MSKKYMSMIITYGDIVEKTFSCGCIIHYYTHKFTNNTWKPDVTKNIYCDFHRNVNPVLIHTNICNRLLKNNEVLFNKINIFKRDKQLPIF